VAIWTSAPVRASRHLLQFVSKPKLPIAPSNAFKGRHFPREVILLCVRWDLRYSLAYDCVAELRAERGVAVAPSCVWRWVQAYAPELNKRCRPHLKPANESYRTDETYIKVKGE
jgi:transposase-like protein